jgi:hypothetical protein
MMPLFIQYLPWFWMVVLSSVMIEKVLRLLGIIKKKLMNIFSVFFVT